MSISERRASYPIQERIKIYSPDSMAKKLHELEKQPNKLVLHGVNILNKVSVDSDTAMSRIRQRRETHNRVERRRRDNLNTLVNELSTLVPRSAENGGPKCHRAKVLRYAIDYIRAMQEENNQLRQQLGQSASPPNSPPNSPPQQDIKISFCP
ncbi:uncharacterized protein RHIMIDRAFT_236792 [Rhizopus microsporus ATCC 52813]|uniref:BHLH domain-containing protein n=1 Tax=Rhizopus microsporus ATCC 52813 TaxID=1340429 RepID=A0A2G4SY68_RHIZD|nr:uncharacterized protein RHIMIDRAFT_236792 [Rhizopus microsporus ATCC 52813]PHZ13738.1 hypothetical protein RHIMIDRAFT_236792 [Rhizopus microsporus ATCC 52813]